MSCFVDVPFVLSRGDEQAEESVPPVTLYLSVNVSANAAPQSILPTNTTRAIAIEIDVSPMEQATEPSIAHVQDSTQSAFTTTRESISPPTDHGPIETSTPILSEPNVRAEMLPAENALRDAYEATKTISLTNTWEGAVARIQWLIDTLRPVAGVRHSAMSFYLIPDLANFRFQLNPYVQMAFSLLGAIPKVRPFVLLSEGNTDAMLI